MKKSTLAFMVVAVGMIVANVYYIQPLLAQIASEFHLRATGAGSIAMVLQIGTTCAMMIFVPLGDTHERRRLVSVLVLALAAALVAMACARNVIWLGIAAAAVGASGSVVHIIIPFAAHLTPANQRGKVVGLLVSGMLIGILLARTASGWIGGIFGWRVMYFAAAGLMLIVAGAAQIFLPRGEPVTQLTYGQLIRSIFQLAREQPVLREAAILGGLFFGAFNAFWTTLAFRLETPPFHYGPAATGMFGLVGVMGAAGAPLMGRLADRRGPRTTVGLGLLSCFLAFLVMGLGGASLVALVVGVLLMDLGVQAGHVSNQTRIYGLIPEARGRLNTVYMTCYFVGGASGSILGAWGWRLAHWWGVCACGLLAMTAGLAIYWRGGRRTAACTTRPKASSIKA